MAIDFGTGVSRTLSAVQRQFSAVVWQGGKPPLDSELNLMSQRDWEALRQVVQSMMPSGFILDPTRTMADYKFDPSWANFFKIGVPKTATGVHEGVQQYPVLWANVNGWVIPVTGTGIDAEGDLSNFIDLYPAPESDARIDFVFLEAWQARVDANPSTVNKPSASTIWKYGNVEYGGTNLADDLEDPTVGMETTARVQVQYRIRVVGSGTGLGASVSLEVYPDGLGDPNVFGQGTSTSPISGLIFSNMGKEGDPSLWRAGNGDPNNSLGTIDGYTYAIPICAVFRRNSGSYVAVNSAGNANQNGSFERTPGSKLLPNPLAGNRVLETAQITFALSPTAGVTSNATISVVNLNGSGLEDFGTSPSNLYLVIDDEIIEVTGIDLINGTITIPAGGRGRFGTAAVGHSAQAILKFYNMRPDGLFADQITETDVLDLRRGVNAQDWDYGRLLEHNVLALCKGSLRSTWKKSGAGDTQGPVVHEVDYLYADGSVAVPNQTEALDGPDGIRTIWSDAAVIQPGVTLLLDNEAIQDTNHYVGFTNDPLDDSVRWGVGAPFYPSAFMNVGTGLVSNRVWTNGSLIFLYTGGFDGTGGARGTFRDGTTRAVRLVTPMEYWKDDSRAPASGFQTPVTMRFLGQRALECAPPGLNPALSSHYPGPMYPWYLNSFEAPFIVLGGLLRNDFKTTVLTTAYTTEFGVSDWVYLDVGIDFDVSGDFYSQDTSGQFENDPTAITSPLLRGERTLWGMLTNNGADVTGHSSEVYLITHGDPDYRGNNWTWKVIGAGTVGYTTHNARNSTSLVCQRCGRLASDDVSLNGNLITVEIRSFYHNAEDSSSYQAQAADVVIGLTDIGGDLSHPWYKGTLDGGYDTSMPMDGNVPTVPAIPSKMLLDLTLQYYPGRGGMARIPDSISQFAMKGGTTQTLGGYLRQSRISVDPNFPAPEDETYWNLSHIQIWNRLSSLGLSAPVAPDFGGNIVGYTEQDREHEVFFDRGSKTLLIRPFRDQEMTLQAITGLIGGSFVSLLGSLTYPGGGVKDALQLFTTWKQMGFPVPYEWMPRFGRQDIPYWQRVEASDAFLPGINHLFTDAADVTASVFNVIGGRTNTTGGNQVTSFFFTTTTPANIGQSTTIVGPAGNIPALNARKTTDINSAITYADEVIASLRAVNSSDFGKGLKGIQLPPYYGIARLYGVYTTADYAAKGGRTFKANRYEPEADAAPNLLREDATEQTLFILQDGAKDLTQASGDHTYIIPSNVLDLTRALTYQVGDTFEDFNYIVECTVFGFSHDWINGNNYVLARHYNGQGTEITDGDDPELEGIHMTIPCAAGNNAQFYVAYDRTVYQGDPYMSRSGDATTSSDYETRYGQIPMANQYLLKTPIQQFDSNGNFVPETPNARGFEILASLDFYTTLGTGKVGGDLFPGTCLDVGYTTPDGYTRMPSSSTQAPWLMETRAFTEGQEGNQTKASLRVAITSATDLALPNSGNAWHYLHITDTDGQALDLYGATPDSRVVLHNPPYSIPLGRIFEIPVDVLPYTWVGLTVLPGEVISQTIPFLGAVNGESVQVIPQAPLLTPAGTGVVVSVRAGINQVTLTAVNVWSSSGFEAATPANVQQITIGPLVGAIPAHSTQSFTPIALAGVQIGDVIALSPTATPNVLSAGLVYSAYCSAPNQITVFAHNTLAVPVGNLGESEIVNAAILSPEVVVDHTYTGNPVMNIHLLRESSPEDRIAKNLSDVLNPACQSMGISSYAEGSYVRVFSQKLGSVGNLNKIDIKITPPVSGFPDLTPLGIQIGDETSIYSSYFTGGIDYPMNAGDGTSQINLTGMTERLPLGALLQDSDFLCEDPLRDTVSGMLINSAGLRPVQTLVPMVSQDEEFTRFSGESGELLALSDGSISVLNYGAWTDSTPTGTRKFRLFRGGGSAYVLSGDNPGGPIDWVSGTFPPSGGPILKGGLLACRALLVRNYYEEIQPNIGSYKVSDGDEIQMVLVTYGILGTSTTPQDGVIMKGLIGPAGYGEGYAAADRFRLTGKPMYRGFVQDTPDPADIQVAVYPDTTR